MCHSITKNKAKRYLDIAHTHISKNVQKSFTLSNFRDSSSNLILHLHRDRRFQILLFPSATVTHRYTLSLCTLLSSPRLHVRSPSPVQRGHAEPAEPGSDSGDGSGVAFVAQELGPQEATQRGVLDDGLAFVRRGWG